MDEHREAFDVWRLSRKPSYPAEFEAWQAATAAERERCASICDGLAEVCEASANGVRRVAGVNTAKSCASVIRME